MKLDHLKVDYFIKNAENESFLQKLKSHSPYDDPVAPNFLLKHAWALYAKDFPKINLGGHFPAGGNFK